MPRHYDALKDAELYFQPNVHTPQIPQPQQLPQSPEDLKKVARKSLLENLAKIR